MRVSFALTAPNPVQSNLKYLTLHNMKLKGNLALTTLNLPKLQFFTLFNNKLSCKLPNYEFDTKNNSVIVLLGNYFTIYKEPKWLKMDPFIEVKRIYINIYSKND